MRRRVPKHLVVGGKALMPVGSPVRQWMYTLEEKPKPCLIPLRYMPPAADHSSRDAGPKYIEVTIAKVTPPYAIVYHHDGQGWVRLWIDMREVHLLLASE
jgi:hypothetical protein